MEVERTGPSILHRTGPFDWVTSTLASGTMSTPTTTPERLDLAADARDLYRAQVALDRAISASAIDPRLHELVKIRASQINGCAYCIDMHTRDALDKGDTQQRLFALAAWRESPLFDDRERAALALTDAVTRIATDAERIYAAYDEAGAHFATEELAALLYAISAINTWNRLAVSTHAVFEP
jgi:AhpD family alkylhydroperoxidase